MHRTNLRKVGGSIMLTVPPLLLEQLQLKAGAEVGLSVENGQLRVEPRPQRQYRLDDLLSEAATMEQDVDRTWLDDAPAGRELI